MGFTRALELGGSTKCAETLQQQQQERVNRVMTSHISNLSSNKCALLASIDQMLACSVHR
jgi:hypothetical protein